MFKQMICDCVVDYTIQPLDPILIKSGNATIQGPDMSFVLTHRNGRWEPYVPGTSLKGVLRSQSERIAATLNKDFNCNPFAKQEFCGNLFEKRERNHKEKLSDATIYRESCPICRTFGSTAFAGRLCPSDAYVTGAFNFEKRDGVGIDRFTGGSYPHAKFNMEVLTRGTFKGQIMVKNFELWQLGLLAFLFKDMEEGYISIGSGTSRGLGRVLGHVESVSISYLVPNAASRMGEQLWGVGEFVDDDEYGFAENDRVALKLPECTDMGIRKKYNFSDQAINGLWQAVAPLWVAYVTAYKVPATMAQAMRG